MGKCDQGAAVAYQRYKHLIGRGYGAFDFTVKTKRKGVRYANRLARRHLSGLAAGQRVSAYKFAPELAMHALLARAGMRDAWEYFSGPRAAMRAAIKSCFVLHRGKVYIGKRKSGLEVVSLVIGSDLRARQWARRSLPRFVRSLAGGAAAPAPARAPAPMPWLLPPPPDPAVVSLAAFGN